MPALYIICDAHTPKLHIFTYSRVYLLFTSAYICAVSPPHEPAFCLLSLLFFSVCCIYVPFRNNSPQNITCGRISRDNCVYMCEFFHENESARTKNNVFDMLRYCSRIYIFVRHCILLPRAYKRNTFLIVSAT